MTEQENVRPKKSYVLPMGKGYKIKREVEHIDWDIEAFRESVCHQPRLVATGKPDASREI